MSLSDITSVNFIVINKLDCEIQLSLFFCVNCYITIEPCRKLKNLFSNLSSFYIIDVDTILLESGLNVKKKSHQFLINTELERLLITGAKLKRYLGIIYINSNINLEIINSVRSIVMEAENSTVENMVILDDYDTPKLKDYYELFDEVVFFPAIKKIRVINCVPRNAPKLNIRLKNNG